MTDLLIELREYWIGRLRDRETEYDKLLNPSRYDYANQCMNLHINNRIVEIDEIKFNETKGFKRSKVIPENDGGAAVKSWLSLCSIYSQGMGNAV